MTLYAFLGALEQGFVYGLAALGVYLTFRVLDFPDLTVDGSLPLGAAVAATAITAGVPPVGALLLAMGAGFVAGMTTGLLHTRLGILHLLASILTMIGLYSITIRIMGRPNLTLLGKPTVLDLATGWGLSATAAGPVLFGLVVVAVAAAVVWYLSTEHGQAMQATGANRLMIESLGVNTKTMIVVGVGLSNALAALCGALVAQNQGAADVNMGVGTIVAGLASVIVGETLVGTGSVVRGAVAAVLGSVVYRLAIALALAIRLGDFSLTPSDLKLVTACIVVLALVAPQIKARLAGAGR